METLPAKAEKKSLHLKPTAGHQQYGEGAGLRCMFMYSMNAGT